MPKYVTEKIRNLAFVGHGSSGKTSFAEAVLFKAGATKREGKVDDGSSNLDYDADEKERQFTIDPAVTHYSYKNVEHNLIDTPGYPDFIAPAIAALTAVETAVVFVSAGSGVQVNTRTVWKEAEKNSCGRVIIMSRMDAENVKFSEALQSIVNSFGIKCVPLYVPDGEGVSFKGIQPVLVENPEGLASEYKEKLIEAIAEVDDALLEKYLGGETLTDEELSSAMTKAISEGTLVPIIPAASAKGIGVEEFMNLAADTLASPAAAGKFFTVDENGENETEEAVSPDGTALGQLFQVFSDPYVGKIGYVKILSGTISTANLCQFSNAAKPEKLGGFIKTLGKEQQNVDVAIAGDIIAVTKVDSIATSVTLSDPKNIRIVRNIKFPVPLVSFAVDPKSRKDETRIGMGFNKLAEQDPTFLINREPDTNELVISGMSDLHLMIILARLKRLFDVEVEKRLPRVPYRETITSNGDAQYRHKKQTGGAGQFGEVWMRIEPLERGAGFEFVDKVVGGSIPKQFLPAIEKGIKAAMTEGIVSGNKVVDVQVTVYDGKYHPVDSKEIAFKIAGKKAFQQSFEKAKPMLLEPIYNITINIPSEFMGAITGDIPSRRGSILGMESEGDVQIIKGQIPLAEIQSYSTELRSITGGEGSYSIEFSHYDVVPPNVAQPIIAATRKNKKADDD